MIIALRAPGLFNHLFCARNTRPGFARMDGYFYGGLFGEIRAGFSRLRRHVQRVRWRADEHGRAVVDYSLKPLRSRLTAAGNGHGAKLPRSLPAGPEADKRTKRKSKIDAIPGMNASRFEYDLPAFRPPFPGFFSVEPVHRLCGGARGLMNSNVAFLRKRQVGTKGRIKGLILD